MTLAAELAAIAAVLLVITRYIAAVKPLWGYVPPRWQWVAPAVFAAFSLCSVRLPEAKDVASAVEVVISTVIVPIVLAAMAGLHGPTPPEPVVTPDVPPPPPPPPSPPTSNTLTSLLVMLAAAGMCFGCAGSFELSRVAGAESRGVARTQVTYKAGTTAVPIDPKRCQSLDDEHQTWTALAKGGAALTGAEGLTLIPVDDKGARIGLAIGAAVAAAFTAFAVSEADGAASSWAKECSSP